jgi:hypothetical protein
MFVFSAIRFNTNIPELSFSITYSKSDFIYSTPVYLGSN